MSLTDVYMWWLCVFHRYTLLRGRVFLIDVFTWWLCVIHICFYVVVVSSTDVLTWWLCVFDRWFYVVLVCLPHTFLRGGCVSSTDVFT